MIVSHLMGGLGNQLWQISASIGIAEFYGREWRVQSDWKYKDYFNIPEDRYVDQYAEPRYEEPHFHYALIPDGNWQLFGYFQSKKYWAHCEDKILEYFSLKHSKTYPKELQDICAIHVRGGDFVKPTFAKEGSQIGGHENHYNLTKEYYDKAKELSGFKKFVCYTDDMLHASKLVDVMAIVQGSRTNDKQTANDLFEMAQYGGLIMANSSYSWWAAMLGKEKKVIAPKQWFGKSKSHYNTSDLYLPEWTAI